MIKKNPIVYFYYQAVVDSKNKLLGFSYGNIDKRKNIAKSHKGKLFGNKFRSSKV